MGLHATPVLLSSGGGVDSSLVSLRQFDHMIVALERRGGYVFLDPTAEVVPVGLLPAAEAGSFALIVHPDGTGEPVMLPRDSQPSTRQLIEGSISPDGLFTGHVTESYTGTAQLAIRAMLSTAMTAMRLAQMTRALAAGWFEGATGDSLHLFDGRDLAA